jgi:putative oxidoreductase
MLFHGIAKLSGGIAWVTQPLSAINMPSAVGYGLYVAELIAPIFMLLGLWTRIAALTIMFDMIMAVILVHTKDVFTLQPQSGGWAIEIEAFYFLAALAIFFLGGGRYSVTRGRGVWD